jgi:hypothetical protein
MKEISIKIDDELYRRASRKVGDLEAESINMWLSISKPSMATMMAFLLPDLTWQIYSRQPVTLAWALGLRAERCMNAETCSIKAR